MKSDRIRRTTQKAILLYDGGDEKWVPLSCCEIGEKKIKILSEVIGAHSDGERFEYLPSGKKQIIFSRWLESPQAEIASGEKEEPNPLEDYPF